MSTNLYVMDKDFVPPRPGRRPLANIRDLISLARESKGEWVGQDFQDTARSNSAIRQLRKYQDGCDDYVEYGSTSNEDGTMSVYLKIS